MAVSCRGEWDSISKSANFPYRDLARGQFESVGHPSIEMFIGQTFDRWVDDHGGHPSDALADWLQLNDLSSGLVYATANSSFEHVRKLLNTAIPCRPVRQGSIPIPHAFPEIRRCF